MSSHNNTTKPSIETVLERVNALGDQLNGQLTELRNGQAELRTEVAELRSGQAEMRNDLADLNSGQRKLVRRMRIINETLLEINSEIRADSLDFDRRLEKLESKLP